MIGNRNIVDAANGELVDREHRHACSSLGHPSQHVLKKLILGHTLYPHEQRVGPIEDEFALEQETIQRVAG